jgi:hypothetical protein
MPTTTTKDIFQTWGLTNSVVNSVVSPSFEVNNELSNEITVAELVSQTWHDKDSIDRDARG